MDKKGWSLSFNIFKKRTSSESNGLSSSSSGSSKTEIGIEDFKIVRKLGHGGFGRVFLAKYNQKMVALKVIVKKEIPDSKTDKEHVKAEHFCLTNFGHPFLVKLFCSYQTPTKLFYAMEFCQGGELFSWLEKFGKFKKVISKIYFDFSLHNLEYFFRMWLNFIWRKFFWLSNIYTSTM